MSYALEIRTQAELAADDEATVRLTLRTELLYFRRIEVNLCAGTAEIRAALQRVKTKLQLVGVACLHAEVSVVVPDA